LMRFEIAKRTT